ncbi:MAG: dienelactone hydrolase family protein [Thermomicrobiales bacterium]
MGEWVPITGTTHEGYLAQPANDGGPGVLVLHAWWGLTPVFTSICDQLAAAGYVALAPSLFADRQTADTIPGAEALRDSADEETTVGPVVQAATDQLRALPGVAATPLAVIGFSLGAYWAFDCSQRRPDDIGAVVVFYGAGEGEFSSARAAYLGHFAEQDPYEDLGYVRELETAIRDAGREVTFHVYPGAQHWFVEPNRPEFAPAAAELAWARTHDFLAAHLT